MAANRPTKPNTKMIGSYPTLRKRRGKPSHLDDPQVRTKLIALASTGMSRRGVAARAGFGHTNLHDWLERGRANPEEEPWGSFARDYLMAERGIEEAGSQAEAHRVLQILKACEAGGFPYTCSQCGHQGNKHLDIKELEWVGRVKERRFPEDYGTSAHHRKPEQEPSGEAWHERNGLNHAQLVHMMKKPPEQIAKALVEAADNVYELLLASGWQPKEK